jgi:type IV pilus assembly protein PilM
LFRSFERFLRREEDRNSVNAFVEMGYSATRVVVSRGPKIIFFKSIPIGGARFDELVAEQMDLPLNEAAELRIRLYRQHVAEMTGQTPDASQEEPVGESVARAVFDALRPALEQLAKEIALCLRYCSVTFRGIRSNEVTVVGGEACNQDILRMLSDQVNLPFHVGRPMRNVGAEPDFGGADRRTGQPEWATVLGLALKPIRNLEEAAA